MHFKSRIPERLLVLLKEEYPEGELQWKSSGEKFYLDGVEYSSQRDWVVAVIEKIHSDFPYPYVFPTTHSSEWLDKFQQTILEYSGLYRKPEFSDKWLNDLKKDKKRKFLYPIAERLRCICASCYSEWKDKEGVSSCCITQKGGSNV